MAALESLEALELLEGLEELQEVESPEEVEEVESQEELEEPAELVEEVMVMTDAGTGVTMSCPLKSNGGANKDVLVSDLDSLTIDENKEEKG